MSKTGTIGFVGGQAYPNIINIFEGINRSQINQSGHKGIRTIHRYFH